AMKLGAFDFLLKPLDIKTLRELVHKAFEISRLMRVPTLVDEQQTPAEIGNSDALVGRCPAMQEVYKAIGRVAPQNVTVLVLGDMSALTQTKVLRVLQDQRFERLGGGETIQTDVRLIAATNHDLERLVADSRFRSDLFYRLSIFTIKLPPLRDRGDDLPLLVE